MFQLKSSRYSTELDSGCKWPHFQACASATFAFTIVSVVKLRQTATWLLSQQMRRCYFLTECNCFFRIGGVMPPPTPPTRACMLRRWLELWLPLSASCGRRRVPAHVEGLHAPCSPCRSRRMLPREREIPIRSCCARRCSRTEDAADTADLPPGACDRVDRRRSAGELGPLQVAFADDAAFDESVLGPRDEFDQRRDF